MARREKQLNSLSIKAEKYKCGEIRMCEKERVLESQTPKVLLVNLHVTPLYTHNMDAGLFDYSEYSLGY